MNNKSNKTIFKFVRWVEKKNAKNTNVKFWGGLETSCDNLIYNNKIVINNNSNKNFQKTIFWFI